MALTSAISPVPVSGYSIAFIAACGGGISWLLVMTAGGGFHHTQDRNKLILAGIAFSAFCMALTRITLLLTEDHAYGIFTGSQGRISRTLAGVLAAFPGGGGRCTGGVAVGQSTEPA
jgi:iron complex transport system permease protein